MSQWRALVLLAWLRARGAIRLRVRRMSRARNIVVSVVGLAIVGAWGVSVLVQLLTGRSAMRGGMGDTAWIEVMVPLVLLSMAVVPPLLHGRVSAVSFTPAEVGHLFAGPFSRRVLLLYKLLVSVAWTLPAGLIFGVVLGRSAGYAGAVIGCVLGAAAATVGSAVLALGRQNLAARIGPWGAGVCSLVVVGLLGAAVAVPMARATASVLGRGASDGASGAAGVMEVLSSSVAVRVVSAPLLPSVLVITRPAAEAALWGVGGVLVVVGLVWLALRLDRRYLEAALEASAAAVRRDEAKKGAGPKRVLVRRVSVPMIGGGGGLGVGLSVAWRQATALVRGQGVALVMLMALGVGGMLAVGWFVPKPSGEGPGPFAAIRVLALGGLMVVSVLCGSMMRADFRGEGGTIGWLKTLPARPVWIAWGELAVPTAVSVVMLWSGCVAAAISMPEHVGLIAALALAGPPLAVVVLSVDNAFYLLFPARASAGTMLDFQQTGRVVILSLARAVAVGLSVMPAGLVGWGAWAASGSAAGGVAAGAVVLAGMACLGVVVVGSRFARFDPSMDRE